MAYRVYHIKIDEQLVDILQALVAQELKLEGVSYDEDGFQFYVDSTIDDKEVVSCLDKFYAQFQFTYHSKELEDKNWNAIWESEFEAVEVGEYCRVRAQFHSINHGFKHDIIVHPGMAFGTGHHETTWMMIDAISRLDVLGKSVLDAGCGTGVLAILAAKEGADKVEAFDYDINSVDSSNLNKDLNNLPNIIVTQATVAKFEGKDYDFILANINRNIILESLSSFKEKLAFKGMIIVSGYLKEDEHLIRSKAEEIELHLIDSKTRGEWCCQIYQ